jgi:hypothetical protein
LKGSVLALMAVVAIATTPGLGSPIEPGAIEVLDGDTIRAGGRTFRLLDSIRRKWGADRGANTSGH